MFTSNFAITDVNPVQLFGVLFCFDLFFFSDEDIRNVGLLKINRFGQSFPMLGGLVS